MHTTAILCHPYEKSFNHAILQTVRRCAEARGDRFSLIDLYADGFQPAMSREELAVYMEGRSPDPLVSRYNEILKDTDEAVLIFPIWWYDMPAMLRGFFDKVMLPKDAYTGAEIGLSPLRSIPKTRIFTTSSALTDHLVEIFGDPVGSIMIPHTLRMVGFHGCEWHNLGGIDSSTPAQRQEFLKNVEEWI